MISALPSVGTPAPAFFLPDQTGSPRTLAGERGKWVLVYFYPKDATPGCTTEACALRDAWSELAARGCVCFGISADTVASHARFAAKHRLPFTLLADPDKTAIGAYGAWGSKTFMGKTYDGILRVSFLIDPDGRIAKVYPKVVPAEHAPEVLADLNALRAA